MDAVRLSFRSLLHSFQDSTASDKLTLEEEYDNQKLWNSNLNSKLHLNASENVYYSFKTRD
jgi:hypothetical protein